MQSNTIAEIEQLYKIKLEENKNKLDILITKKAELSEKLAKEEVKILIMLPEKYTIHYLKKNMQIGLKVKYRLKK